MKLTHIRGFTLVELIVVIVVLGILSTLGFVSYQGHSIDARDTKRKTDITNLTKRLELIKTRGEDIFNFVANDNAKIITNIQISGYQGDLELGSTYTAGDADFVYLDVVGENFTDPLTGDNYKIGVTSHQNRYELAAGLENEGNFSIYTDGTWLPRTSEGTKIARDKIIGNIFYMSGSTRSDSLLEKNDIVRVGSGSVEKYTIKRIYPNRIELDRDIVNTGDNIFLNINETRHLIKKWDSDWAIKADSGAAYTPYNLQ